jgi:hypothetical protein
MLSMQVLFNTTSCDEHVGDIEWFLHTIKERMRCSYTTLPFQTVPDIMVVELAKRVQFFLNAFPPSGGISTTLSPCTIVTGQTIHHD